jgi:hypothetical protein
MWWQNSGWVLLWYLVLDLIFYRQIISPSRMVFGTDWLAGGYPIRNFFFESGHSQWNPYLYGGLPHFSNAGDVYFPITILLKDILGLPVHQYFAYLFILITLVGGFFAYLFLKRLKLSFWPSFIGGLSYMFTGILVSYVYGGHEGRMAIVAFLPVIMWLIQLALEKQTLVSFLAAGLGLGCPLLIPHVQMNYYLLILVFFYFVLRLFEVFKQSRSWVKTIKLSAYFVTFIVIGFLISAVLYVPFYKYIPYSPRGGEEGRGYEFATSWSMNPEETINMAIPEFSGTSVGQGAYWGRNFFKLHSEYMGATVILLAISGLYWGRRNKLVIFFLVIILLGFTVAWGGHTPIYKLYYNLVPGFKKFRAPSLIYFLIAFSTVALSAFGLQYIIDQCKKTQESKGLIKFLVLFVGVVAALAFLVSIGSAGVKSTLAGLIADDPAKKAALEVNFPRFIAGMWKYVLLTGVVGAILVALMKQRLKLIMAGVALCLVVVIDLWLEESKFIQTVAPPQVYFRADEVTEVIRPDTSLYRVFPYQYRNDNYPMLFGIQSVAGEHGNQLQRYNEFLGAGKRSMVDYHNIISSLNFLNLANVKYMVARQPISHPAFREIHRGNFYIYENLQVMPRALVVPKYQLIAESESILARMRQPDFDPRETVILEKTPDLAESFDSVHSVVSVLEYGPMEVRIRAELDRPGLLVLLDNYYPDWKAYLNGDEKEIYRADYTFRAVSLPAGNHQLEFKFEPRYYEMGKKISLFSLLGVLGILAGSRVMTLTKGKRISDK